jgi:hypothetical protein
VDANVCSFEDIFVIEAVVHMLEASRPANVVDEQSRKVRLLVFNVSHRSVETLSTSDI